MKEKVAACCVILNEVGEVLVLHRNTKDWKHWELPGGKPEPDETIEETAKREVKEETGLEVEIVKEIGVGKFVEKDTNFEFHWFSAVVVAGIAAIPEEEKRVFDDIRYISLSELQGEDIVLSLNLRELLSKYLQGTITL